MGLNLWLNSCYRGWFHSVFGWVGILVQWVWIYLVMFVFLKKKNGLIFLVGRFFFLPKRKINFFEKLSFNHQKRDI
jgi:hypothetical protein